ncbi:hypothetical protein ACIQVL_19020 [Streptomyces sp. NPDC090499]|uniref:hypothetical protein n=1 Tax=Streptomyces sp. NPDC090499 TaxID=3365965 RepID=UPI003828ACA2
MEDVWWLIATSLAGTVGPMAYELVKGFLRRKKKYEKEEKDAADSKSTRPFFTASPTFGRSSVGINAVYNENYGIDQSGNAVPEDGSAESAGQGESRPLGGGEDER